MRIVTTTTAAVALTLFATAARAGSIFDGAFDYESPIAMMLHVAGNIVGKVLF